MHEILSMKGIKNQRSTNKIQNLNDFWLKIPIRGTRKNNLNRIVSS